MSDPAPATESDSDNKLARSLAASVIRRAPMDAANLLMKHEDATVIQVLDRLQPSIAQKILRRFPEDRSESLSQDLTENIYDLWEMNLQYPEDAIGRAMEPASGTVPHGFTVRETIDYIQQEADRDNVFTYAYVVDDDGVLLGVIVMRDLLFSGDDWKITDIMIEDPFRFTPETKIQDAILDVVHRHYPLYPVCDDTGRLVGLIQGYELFEEHAIEVSAQSGRMVGVDNEEHLSTPIMQCFRYRHPWLQLNLGTAFLAAFVVGFFENTIQQIVVLAAFLPVLAGQSGNTGCQALAVTLRGMTLGEIKQGLEHQLVMKELKLGLINGALVGVTAALGMLAYAGIGDSDTSALMLAGVVFLAMTASCVASGVTGVLVPLLLKKLGADPVTASTIFLTTATDVLSMGLLLGLATLLLI